MAREIHLDQTGDKEPAVQEAVTQLEAGRLVLLPDECGWSLAGLATCDAAAGALQRIPRQGEQMLQSVSIADPGALSDYMKSPSPLLQKLSARCWPGPVILRIGRDQVDGIDKAWSPEAQKWGLTAQGRAFYCPADSFAQAVLGKLFAPALTLVGTASDKAYDAVRDRISLVIHPAEARFSELPTVAVLDGDRLKIERPGVVSERMLARLGGEVYLFVCTGNTCRSPMAEAMFRKMLADRLSCREDELLDRGFTVISAGLAAHQGASAGPEAVDLLREQGIDLSGHESQSVTEDLLFHCDHILTMTRSHREAVISAYPELADQVQLLSPQGQDVPDPIGAGMEEYVRCRDAIAEHLHGLLNEIDFSKS